MSQENNNAGEITQLTGHRRTSCRCCCLTAVLTLLSVATVAGILVWVLNREEAPSTVNNLLGNISNGNHLDSSDVSNIFTTITTTTTSTTTTTTTTTSKQKSDIIIFPTKKHKEGFHETKNIQGTTEPPRSTTFETKYTEIITKMKEMRKKNRLSSVRNYALTTEDFLETSTTTSPFPLVESKPPSSGPVDDKNVDISDNANESRPEELENKTKFKVVKTEPVIETNITETEADHSEPDVEQNVKLSKALIFDDELSSAATVQIRNERNQVKSVKLNNLHSDLLEKAVKKSNSESSKSSVTVERSLSTTTNLIPSKASTVQETIQSSSSQQFFVYPQVPALKTYTVDPGAETFCK